MNIRNLCTLALTAATAAITVPAHSQSGQLSSEAPAVVLLDHKLDAQKLASGGSFDVRLLNNVHLANGTEIPKGSRLVATVADDDMQVEGRNKLVLRFTAANAKGQQIPIKATILAVNTEQTATENDPYDIEVNMPVPKNLNDQTDEVDATINGSTTLHSRATSNNSGVLVSDKDVRLPEGTKMELAIAPASSM